MNVIIDFDAINDPNKRDWLINTLKIMGINFQTAEKRQTLEEYNQDLEEGENDFQNGRFSTIEELKNRMKEW